MESESVYETLVYLNAWRDSQLDRNLLALFIEKALDY
jgi:hypothetical protein